MRESYKTVARATRHEIERVKGSPVSTRVHNYSQILGLVFVLALLVYVTYNDILKLL